MRPIVVGITPKRGGSDPLDPRFPSGARLARMCGMVPEEFRERFDLVNLHPFGSELQDDEEAARNLSGILRGRRVVCLGGRVANALGVEDELFAWGRHGEFVSAYVPHPSGLSRWWNHRGNQVRAEGFWRGVLRPCIHVEGMDGAGKTTLVSILAERLGEGFRSIPTDDPPKSAEECWRRVGVRLDPGLVCDRSSGLLSELVYAPVLRGGTLSPEPEFWTAVRSILHAVTFVFCRPPLESIRLEFREGEDPDHVRGVQERCEALYRKYDEVMSRVSSIGGRVLRYDWTRDSVDGLVGQL